MKPARFLIGNLGADFVSLAIANRHDDWLTLNIEVHCDGWSGRFNCSSLAGSLKSFGEDVARLKQSLPGSASLETTESNLEVTLTGDGKGHIAVTGVALNTHAHGTELRFAFEIDQTYLDEIARELVRMDTA